MESIKVKQYKNDSKSFFTYLGSARAKEIAFQHTENPDLKLLDIVFETVLDDHRPAEFSGPPGDSYGRSANPSRQARPGD